MAERTRKTAASVLGAGLDSLLSRVEDAPPDAQDLPDNAPTSAPTQDLEEPLEPEPVRPAFHDTAAQAPVSPPPPAAVAEPAGPEPPASPGSAPTETVIQVEDAELLEMFVQEANDHLQTMEARIVALETVSDPENVNAIFRCMHTIKGNSSFLGMSDINRLSHRLESLLDDLRNGRAEAGPEVIDILLSGTDTLLAMIGGVDRERRAVQAGSPEGGPFELRLPKVESAPLLARIAAVLGEGPPVVSAAATGAPPAPPATGEQLVTDEIAQRFLAETADLLDAAERALLDLETEAGRAERVDEAFRAIHTVKGNAGFMGYELVETACMKTEGELEEVRSGRCSPTAQTISALLGGVDAIRRALEPARASVPVRSDLAGRPVGEILVGLGVATEEEVEHALQMQDRRVGEILVAEGTVKPDVVHRALELQSRPAGPAEGAAARKDIRVDTAKLDKLFDLMGELMTAEALVIHNPEVRALELEDFGKSAAYLSKITREMQEITLSVRMIPLEGLFTKMRRLVRDLARKSGKGIELLVSGQETEMDRNVTEEVSDPLVHLIRNAIDHGVEPEATRRAAGKPAAGTLTLSARYEGNEIWVGVADDGAGLNRPKILAKARERGLLAADPDTLTDEQVWAFIFEPGFSTADTVSDVSGRGVGMDVVKRNMDKLRGKVDIASEAGKGTRITLKIPLTLAIIDGISVRVGHSSYVIPLADVVLFHKAGPEQITRTAGGREIVRLREELIPVIRLHVFFKVSGARTAIDQGILLVAQRGGSRAALLVDEILGYQQIVVKPLPAYLSGLRAVSGCSILGNGDVSLILDTASLIAEELQ